MATHNLQKYDKIPQERGTGILEFDTISGWVLESVTDRTALGRWCWIKLMGKNGNIYSIFCANQPCIKLSSSFMVLGTVYYKQRRYYRATGDFILFYIVIQRRVST